MKEMIYQKDSKIELLYHGTFFEYDYYILNLGTHPTAYVKLQKEDMFYNKSYNEIDIDCHGGLTYSSNKLISIESDENNEWFIGWDYGHCGDYSGYDIMFKGTYLENTSDKKWTTEEIKKECVVVCSQLKDLNFKLERDE